MKIFLEEDSLDDKGEKIIIKVKEIKDKEEAIRDKKKKKSYLHICRHEEGLPCSREAI